MRERAGSALALLQILGEDIDRWLFHSDEAVVLIAFAVYFIAGLLAGIVLF